MSEPIPLEHLRSWVGREERRSDVLRPWPAAALTAALDREDPPGPGDPLPPFWHHLYFLPVVAAARTGPDGHPRRGDFLPPVPLPRRMWAGGRLHWERSLRIGEELERVSTVRAVDLKHGRSGPLVFVTVEHRFFAAGRPVLVEEQDIVYREPPRPEEAFEPPLAPTPGPWQRRWRPDPVLLFRYSALTYNGHRIHYDHPYATRVEGYRGLIVHGPLLATLMLDLLRRERPQAFVRRFDFRATAPLFADEELTVHGDPETANGTVRLWVTGPRGELAMLGTVALG
ncbi:MAG: MaoC family dehydratase N-terminal domain-containing protein [Geminicoccaceae bacterium]|nr:MaoC family dehydratase N-terminal domain-containing protein [Geminicoccaceae bacterium]MDW8342159.1 MaoC family dehydratase N-terminal domain-containing protein [Geminicoccaceae bacterium]